MQQIIRKKNKMKKKQFILSRGLDFFREQLIKNYNMKCVNESGYDPFEPCVFIGMYEVSDYDRLAAHKGMRVVLWGGSDANNSESILMIRNTLPMTKHIAQSHFIENHLLVYRVKSERHNVVMTDWNYWKPEPLGDKIYFYCPSLKYGSDYIDQIKELPYELILITRSDQYTREETRELYKECFTGLRLTYFDGNPNTVTEMGLMGRKTIYNGATPAGIPWKDFDDIERIIDQESSKISLIDHHLAMEVDQWIDKKGDWF